MDNGYLPEIDLVPMQPSIIHRRSSTRRAFTLIELLVMVAVMPFVMVAVSGVYATFIRDIPRTTRVLQENTTVLDLLRQIQRDMDRATGLPEQFDGQTAGADLLLIEQSGRVIGYRRENGQVVRTVLQGRQTSVAAEQRNWRMPHAEVTWRPWVREGRAYAVEIHSHIRQRISGLAREVLANSHVFFVHGAAAEGEVL
jgi:type II secretory pathway pseudopilin PulG